MKAASICSSVANVSAAQYSRSAVLLQQRIQRHQHGLILPGENKDTDTGTGTQAQRPRYRSKPNTHGKGKCHMSLFDPPSVSYKNRGTKQTINARAHAYIHAAEGLHELRECRPGCHACLSFCSCTLCPLQDDELASVYK